MSNERNDQITNQIFIDAISESLSVDEQINLVKRVTRRMSSGKSVLDFLASPPVNQWMQRNLAAINASSGTFK